MISNHLPEESEGFLQFTSNAMYDTKVKQYSSPKFGPELVSQETTNSLYQMTLEDDENCQRLKQRINQ